MCIPFIMHAGLVTLPVHHQKLLQPFLNAFPIPNGPDRIIGGVATGAAGFAASHSDPSTLDAVSIRVDHVVGQKLALFARYNHAPSDNIQRGAQGASLNTINRASFTTQTLTGGATWTISPTLDNEFRANWSRSKGNLLRDIDDFGGAVVIPDSAFFPPFALRDSASGVFGTFNNLGTSIFASYAIGTPLANVQRQFDIVNNFSANIGTHRLKVGIDYRRLSPSSNPFSYSEQGFVSINTAPTGKAISVVIQGRQPVDLVFNNWSAYFQDSWKVVPRLSLTYGVRWDVNPPPSGQDDKALYTAQGLGNPATLTLAPRGTPLWRTTYGNFAPRVGVAYRLTDNQARATVLRAGFGIFYDLGTGTSATAANGFPYATAKILANVPYPPDIPTATPPAFNLTPSGASITAYPNLKLPRVYQWSVAMEQSLTASQAISATYIGAAGRRLLHQVMLSNPNPQFASVRITDNSATSDYDALQLQYNRRLSRGLQVLASYTWSHSIDDASTDYIDLDRARGPSDFDVRHSFSTAVSYNIPSPSAGGFAKAVLGDWSIDTVTSARSATPVNLIARTVTLADGSRQNIRPDLIASVPLYIYDPSFPGGREFNSAAFAIPPATPIRQGTLGRNALRSFSVLQVDFALRRQFPISDRLNLQFRADFFNILNHPNFGDPVNSLASGLFGQSTAMLGRSLGSGGVSGGFSPLYQIGGPRSIQLALRLRF